MTSPYISIIMPVYKSEKYLRKSVEAVLSQSFKDFELLLVDDCSPDNSGAICDEYAQKDNRVKVLHLAKNGVILFVTAILTECWVLREQTPFLSRCRYLSRSRRSFLISQRTPAL